MTSQKWQFKVARDASGDLLATGMATTWNDHVTCTGIPADRKDLVACSIPRETCPETMGSGFKGVPALTLVRVYNAATGKVIVAPIIDEGPNHIAEAGTGVKGSALIDLTAEAAKQLGLRDNGMVSIRVLMGTHKAVKQAREGLWK